MSSVDRFINALEEYRSARDEWDSEVSRAGFYDPCGYAEQYAKIRIEEAKMEFLAALKACQEEANAGF